MFGVKGMLEFVGRLGMMATCVFQIAKKDSGAHNRMPKGQSDAARYGVLTEYSSSLTVGFIYFEA